MSTEIALVNEYDAELAALLGQNAGGGSTGNNLPILKVNYDHEVTIDGTDYQVPAGAFKVAHEGKTVYAKTVTFRPFLRRYQYRRFDPLGGKEGSGAWIDKSVQIADMRQQAFSERGGVACGKLRGKESQGPMSADQKVIQDQVQSFTLVYGLVSLKGETYNKEKVELTNFPVLFQVRGANWKPLNDTLDGIDAAKRMFPTVELTLKTRKEKKGSTTYYVVEYAQGATPVPLTGEDTEIAKVFLETVKAENETVMAKHREATAKRSKPANSNRDPIDDDFDESFFGSGAKEAA